jgi:hypothetical protein
LAVDLENFEIQKSDKELFIGFDATQCIQKNNMENFEIQKSDKELFIGFDATQCIQKNNMEGTSGVSIFRKEVRSFYVGCLTYIKKNPAE